MGVESFYLNIKLLDDNTHYVKNLMETNFIYKKCFNYFIDKNTNELCLQGALVCFFPICEIIYSVLNEVNKKNTIVSINSQNVSKSFDFSDSFDFFYWLYNIWKYKLESFYEDWGAFLISPSNYYKTRRKLRKKYYIKYKINKNE